MTTHEFNNQASQSERKAIVKKRHYFSRQSNTVDDAGGRYAKLTRQRIGAAQHHNIRNCQQPPWKGASIKTRYRLAMRSMQCRTRKFNQARTGADPSSGCFSHY